MLCQNTCEVPFGITAIVVVPLVSGRLHAVAARAATTSRRHDVLPRRTRSPPRTPGILLSALSAVSAVDNFFISSCRGRHVQVPEPLRVAAEHRVAFALRPI